MQKRCATAVVVVVYCEKAPLEYGTDCAHQQKIIVGVTPHGSSGVRQSTKLFSLYRYCCTGYRLQSLWERAVEQEFRGLSDSCTFGKVLLYVDCNDRRFFHVYSSVGLEGGRVPGGMFGPLETTQD